MNRILNTAILVTATLVAAALPASAQNLTGAGATFPTPIYTKWFDSYQKKTGIAINYQSIGSGAGIQQVKAGTVDFGASDAALSNDRLKELPRKIVHFPTVGGAVALVYNLPGFDQPLQLTSEIIAGIYLGQITVWNDKKIAAANPGVTLPPAPVLAVHRSDGSGTTNIFTTYLSAVNGGWKEMIGANTSVSWPAGIGGKGNEGVSGLVRQTPGSIGYVELAYAKQNKLSVALIQNKAGKFVMPSLASTTAAVEASAAALAKDVRTPIVNATGPDAYPIAGLTFLLVYRDGKDPAKAKMMADFLTWAMHEGQTMTEALDYARLPAGVIKVNEDNIRTLTANGKPVFAAN